MNETESVKKKLSKKELAQNIYDHKVFRYVLSGGISAAVDIAVFYIISNFVFHQQNVKIWGWTSSFGTVSLIISYTCGSTTSFLINKYFVFSSKDSVIHQLLKSLPVYVLAFFGNLLFLKLFLDYAHLWPILSRGFAAVIVAFISFNLHKFFTFKPKNNTNDGL